MAARRGQRDFLPKSNKNRYLQDVVLFIGSVSASTTLSLDEQTLISLTSSSKSGSRVFCIEDITVYEGSIDVANRIPGGDNVTKGTYQVIGPFHDLEATDGNNVVSKLYIRHKGVPVTFTKRLDDVEEDGRLLVDGSTWDANASSNAVGENSGGDDLYFGVRFTNVTIPQGSTIDSAKITFVDSATHSNSINAKIIGIDEDNTSAMNGDPVAGGRAQTTAKVDWDVTSQTSGNTRDTPSVKDIVQEIVDRGGWSSGNAMGFIVDNDGTGSAVLASYESYDSDSSKAALLTVTYRSSSDKTIIYVANSRMIYNVTDQQSS